MQTTLPPTHQSEKPIPVFAGLLLIVAIAMNGFSFFSGLYLLLNATARTTPQVSTTGIVLSMALNFAVIVLAIIAWKGSRRILTWFLVLNTMYMGLLVFNNVYAGLTSNLGEDTFKNWWDVIRGLLIIALYLYYFNRDDQKAYFSK